MHACPTDTCCPTGCCQRPVPTCPLSEAKHKLRHLAPHRAGGQRHHRCLHNHTRTPMSVQQATGVRRVARITLCRIAPAASSRAGGAACSAPGVAARYPIPINTKPPGTLSAWPAGGTAPARCSRRWRRAAWRGAWGRAWRSRRQRPPRRCRPPRGSAPRRRGAAAPAASPPPSRLQTAGRPSAAAHAARRTCSASGQGSAVGRCFEGVRGGLSCGVRSMRSCTTSGTATPASRYGGSKQAPGTSASTRPTNSCTGAKAAAAHRKVEVHPVDAGALPKGAKLLDVAALAKLAQHQRHVVLAEPKHCAAGRGAGRQGTKPAVASSWAQQRRAGLARGGRLRVRMGPPMPYCCASQGRPVQHSPVTQVSSYCSSWRLARASSRCCACCCCTAAVASGEVETIMSSAAGQGWGNSHQARAGIAGRKSRMRAQKQLAAANRQARGLLTAGRLRLLWSPQRQAAPACATTAGTCGRELQERRAAVARHQQARLAPRPPRPPPCPPSVLSSSESMGGAGGVSLAMLLAGVRLRRRVCGVESRPAAKRDVPPNAVAGGLLCRGVR